MKRFNIIIAYTLAFVMLSTSMPFGTWQVNAMEDEIHLTDETRPIDESSEDVIPSTEEEVNENDASQNESELTENEISTDEIIDDMQQDSEDVAISEIVEECIQDIEEEINIESEEIENGNSVESIVALTSVNEKEKVESVTCTPGVLGGTIEVEPGTKVKLSTKTNNAIILYFLNELPSFTDALSIVSDDNRYISEIEIQENTTVYAIAYKEAFADSDITSFHFTIKDMSAEKGDVLEEDLPGDESMLLAERVALIPKGFWISPVKSTIVYSGKANTPEVRVYYGKKILTKSKDYTLSYKDNINAGTATIIAAGRGNYYGNCTAEFEITRYNLQAENIIVNNKLSAYNAKKAQVPNVTVSVNGKKLAINKDFVLEWTNESGEYKKGCIQSGEYAIYIKGINNYANTIGSSFRILEENLYLLSNVKADKIPNQLFFDWDDASNKGVMPKPVLKNVKGEVLVEGTDYDSIQPSDYSNNKSAGTASLVLHGKGNYRGDKVVSFIIKGISISSAKVSGIDSAPTYNPEKKGFHYIGEAIEPAGPATNNTESGVIVLKYKEEVLKKGEHYTVSYTKNINAGTASIEFKGVGAYSGTLKYTFKILPVDISASDNNFTASLSSSEYGYSKAGVFPEVDVQFNGKVLTKDKDYKISYANNKKVLGADAIKNNKPIGPSVTIIGKGNFFGKSQTLYFSIVQKDIALNDIFVGDSVATDKVKSYAVSPTISEVIDGKVYKLSQNTDFNHITYTYEYDTEIVKYDAKEKTRESTLVKKGTLVSDNDIISDGTVLRLTVDGINNYKGSIYTTFRISKRDIAKATVKIANQEYRGKAVTPGKDQVTSITFKEGRETLTLAPYEYEIIGYSKNESTGTATMTIHGLGSYGGYKTVNFKITAKSMFYTVRYYANGGTGTMKNRNSTVSTISLDPIAFKRNGYAFIGWNTSIDGSGDSYVDQQLLENVIIGDSLTLYAQWEIIVYTINYKPNGADLPDSIISEYTVETPTFSLYQPSKKGYTFNGWYKEDSFRTKVTSIAKGTVGNISLYAKWTAVKYTITYKLNGGTNAADNPKYYYVYTDQININNPSKQGNTFQGWYRDEAFTEEFDGMILTGSAENITIYAKWREHTYSIVFEPNTDGKFEYSGSVSPQNNLRYSESVKLPGTNAFTAKDYVISSWNTMSNGKGNSYIPGKMVSKITAKDNDTIYLYAIWKEKPEVTVYKKIMAMQSKYPEGKKWDNSNYYGWKGGIYSGGYGCAGFAFLLSDAAFGSAPARIHRNKNNVRVGDILRLNNDGHSVIVLEIQSDGVIVAEGNYNSSIHWGRKIPNGDICKYSGDYIMTRW